MNTVYITGKNFHTIQEVHRHLSQELDFPSYYGCNLSALHDVLTDLRSDTRIVMDLSSVTDEVFLEKLLSMAHVIADASEDNEALEIECIQ